jgi:NAD(P)-dependent dehydrogenase (short-subunit alcohol dehydrogenase family)
MELRFENKTAIVTGGARGLSRRTAEMLAEGGADVIIGDVLDDIGHQTCAEIAKATGRNISYMHVDIRDQGQVDALFACAPRIDLVMHGAGILVSESLLDAKDEDIKRIFDINIYGSINVVRSALRKMIPEKQGKIVLLSSIAGRLMDGTIPYYRISKSAVLSIALNAARVAAPYNINVNAICPGVIRTTMWEELLDHKEKAMGVSREEAWNEAIGRLNPLGHPQTETDIASAALFLLSSYADNITGQALNVDGGAIMRI